MFAGEPHGCPGSATDFHSFAGRGVQATVGGVSPFFFNATATPEIYTLSLHDALPISCPARLGPRGHGLRRARRRSVVPGRRSEEHTSELQSRRDLVCRLLLEKKN